MIRLITQKEEEVLKGQCAEIVRAYYRWMERDRLYRSHPLLDLLLTKGTKND